MSIVSLTYLTIAALVFCVQRYGNSVKLYFTDSIFLDFVG